MSDTPEAGGTGGRSAPPILPNVLLRVEMQGVLRSRFCRSFAFRCGSVAVDYRTFETVAYGLYYTNNLDAPTTDGAGKRYLPVAASFNVVTIGASDNLKGAFNPDNDTFVLPYDRLDGDINREVNVVHEAVHAANDVFLREVDGLDDEAAARIAGECYRGLKTNWQEPPEDPAYQIAHGLAKAALGRGQISFSVADADRRRLGAVLSSSAYSSAYKAGIKAPSGVAMMRGFYVQAR